MHPLTGEPTNPIRQEDTGQNPDYCVCPLTGFCQLNHTFALAPLWPPRLQAIHPFIPPNHVSHPQAE